MIVCPKNCSPHCHTFEIAVCRSTINAGSDRLRLRVRSSSALRSDLTEDDTSPDLSPPKLPEVGKNPVDTAYECLCRLLKTSVNLWFLTGCLRFNFIILEELLLVIHGTLKEIQDVHPSLSASEKQVGQIDVSAATSVDMVVARCWQQWITEGSVPSRRTSSAIKRNHTDRKTSAKTFTMTPHHRQCRLEFCRPSVTDWRRVIFSDESRFQSDEKSAVRSGIYWSGIQQFHKSVGSNGTHDHL
ncbi:hypothetical protein TNCV_940191 [Trichonephila clavipes]|nr:hypothetical protein TNCV_940191 [Trichonephila clavipes]